ncbi:hypothetical protein D5086_005485 [Populus alba]|nr:hypothetical protein POTOM_009098 [Populus tomentosa]
MTCNLCLHLQRQGTSLFLGLTRWFIINGRLARSGKESDELTKKQAHTGEATGWEKTNLGYSPAFSDEKIVEYPPAQPTRIVLLKPSPGKIHDMIKALVSPPRVLHGEDFNDEPEDVEGQDGERRRR